MTGNEMLAQLGQRMEDATVTATSGLLTLSQSYTIDTFVAGDDFTAVAGVTGSTGLTFTSLGITPTVWANGSQLSTSAEFTPQTRLDALNNAQLRVSGLLPDNVLTELESVRAGTTVAGTTAGAVTYTELEAESPASTILNDRIQKVKITSGKFANMISYDLSQEVQDNSYLTATAASPYSWVHSESVYILPTATAELDITYLRQPTAIAASATECELAKSLHETVLDLAEASLWLTANRADRSAVAENRALSFIKVLRGE
jgi:hypothetical protein